MGLGSLFVNWLIASSIFAGENGGSAVATFYSVFRLFHQRTCPNCMTSILIVYDVPLMSLQRSSEVSTFSRKKMEAGGCAPRRQTNEEGDHDAEDPIATTGP